MKAQIAKNEARIDGHDTQIKALFRDVDKLDTDVREIGKSVIRMTTFVGIATPLLTALIVHFMTT